MEGEQFATASLFCAPDGTALRMRRARARLTSRWTFAARALQKYSMPLDSSLVGTRIGPATTDVDARWAMAYAAALEDYLPCYLDTRRPDGIVTHPVFPVCIEWPAACALHDKLRDSQLARSEAVRGVHATYDVTIHRAIRPPERLTTTLTLAAVQRLKPGAYELMRFDTVDAQGRPVCTTWYGTIYRGVEVAGPRRLVREAPGDRIFTPHHSARSRVLFTRVASDLLVTSGLFERQG